jgi:hypothetical protein
MCWSFGLFVSGLAVLSACQVILMTASTLDKTTLRYPVFCDYFLTNGISLSGLFVVTALGLLIATVLKLDFNPISPGSKVFGDAPLNFSVRPVNAAIFALVVRFAALVFAFHDTLNFRRLDRSWGS